jgi:hypothetical protein
MSTKVQKYEKLSFLGEGQVRIITIIPMNPA